MPDPVQAQSSDHLREEYTEMLRAARFGNQEAKNRLLSGMRPILKRMIRLRSERFVKRGWRDSDLIQDVLVTVLEEINSFQGCTPQELDAWLSVIVGRTVDRYDRRSREPKRDVRREVSADGLGESLVGVAPAADEVAVRGEEALRLGAAVGRLLEDQARVVRLHLEQLSWLEIGRQMDRSAEAAFQLHRRACKKLKADLKEP